MVLVAAQVTVHIVDGSSAVTVTDGAPTGDVTIAVGLRDLGDIWGGDRSHVGLNTGGAVLGCLNLTQRDYYGMGKERLSPLSDPRGGPLLTSNSPFPNTPLS